MREALDQLLQYPPQSAGGLIGLWRLVVCEPETKVLEAAQAQAPIAVSAWTDREEVARLLSKYNLLAVPGRVRRRGCVGYRQGRRRD
jgi:hypothetical protein